MSIYPRGGGGGLVVIVCSREARLVLTFVVVPQLTLAEFRTVPARSRHFVITLHHLDL